MSVILETERLRVRKLNEDDAEFIFKLLNTPGWLEFIGDRNIKSVESARQYIVNVPMFLYIKSGLGPYLVELKDSNVPVGMSSLIKRESLEDVDIGYALLPEHAGKGYAFEFSSAMLHYAKTTLGIKRIVAITNTTNTTSINLLKKIGLSFEKTVKFSDEEKDLLLFSI